MWHFGIVLSNIDSLVVCDSVRMVLIGGGIVKTQKHEPLRWKEKMLNPINPNEAAEQPKCHS